MPQGTTDTTKSLTRRTNRRAVLGALGGIGAAGLAGCVQRTRSLLSRDTAPQLSLTIKVPPVDTDPWAVQIGQFLASQLRSVGIAAQVAPTSSVTLHQDVLINQVFDLYISRLPATPDPDYLRGLLHSRFGAEPGWQNPFGYANLEVDTLLEDQVAQTGKRRNQTLADIQRAAVRDQPFTVVAFPEEIHAVQTDCFMGWTGHGTHRPLEYLSLERQERPDDAESECTNVEVAITEEWITENLNPLAVEYRNSGIVTSLIYDPLLRVVDGQLRPWLAEAWNWYSSPHGNPALDVRLRDDLTWHDGRPLTAHDIEFTYEFLQDTSLGEFESPVPSQRFRSQTSLVTRVTALDRSTARLTFRPSSRPVALTALSVPILPASIWGTKTDRVNIEGLDAGVQTTEAFIWNNKPAIGSGPLKFESATREKSVILSPHEDHFLTRSPLDDHLQPYQGGFDGDELKFLVAPSDETAVSMVRNRGADATGSTLFPSTVAEIGRDIGVSLHTTPSRRCYHVGYNTRRAPLGNPRFRRVVARLLDKGYLAKEVFDGFADPATSPLARHDALAPALAWTGSDPVLPFIGTDGRLDVDRARDAFRSAGYRYTNDGKLVAHTSGR